MKEDKTRKDKKDLGSTIKIWGERCIACTRCVRFTNEVSGTGSLTIVNRADKSVAGIRDGVPFEDPMSLNTVDICPVGALIDKRFLYEARVWYARKTKSVCPSCSRGCNIQIETLNRKTYRPEIPIKTTQISNPDIEPLEKTIVRIRPVYNKDVNGYWMCDYGRYNYDHVTSPNRVLQAVGTPDLAVEHLKQAAPGKIAFVVSAWNTCEEMYLFNELARTLEVNDIYLINPVKGERWTAKSGFTIESEKAPNAAFARKLFPSAAACDQLKPGYDAIFVLNSCPEFSLPEYSARHRVSISLMNDSFTKSSNFLFPALSWTEKSGTFVNFSGIKQKFNQAVFPPNSIDGELVVLQKMLAVLGKWQTIISCEGVTRKLAL